MVRATSRCEMNRAPPALGEAQPELGHRRRRGVGRLPGPCRRAVPSARPSGSGRRCGAGAGASGGQDHASRRPPGRTRPRGRTRAPAVEGQHRRGERRGRGRATTAAVSSRRGTPRGAAPARRGCRRARPLPGRPGRGHGRDLDDVERADRRPSRAAGPGLGQPDGVVASSTRHHVANAVLEARGRRPGGRPRCSSQARRSAATASASGAPARRTRTSGPRRHSPGSCHAVTTGHGRLHHERGVAHRRGPRCSTGRDRQQRASPPRGPIWISVPVVGHTPQSKHGVQRQSSCSSEFRASCQSSQSQSRSSPESRWSQGRISSRAALAGGEPVEVDALEQLGSAAASDPPLVGEVLAPAVEPLPVAPDPLDDPADPPVAPAEQAFDQAGLAVVVAQADVAAQRAVAVDGRRAACAAGRRRPRVRSARPTGTACAAWARTRRSRPCSGRRCARTALRPARMTSWAMCRDLQDVLVVLGRQTAHEVQLHLPPAVLVRRGDRAR